MKKNLTNLPYYFFFIILSYIFAFLIGENSTGGAIIDYTNQKKLSEAFAKNFLNTLNNYETFGTRHSPIIPMFLGVLEYLSIPDKFIRLFHSLISLSLPVMVFKCLSVKYDFLEFKIKILIISLIFLSPTFRSLSVWPDSRILGLVFFVISIYYYLHFEKNNLFRYAILNTFYLSIAAYLSPNFAVFAIFFFARFLKIWGINKKIFILIFLNIFLACPAFYFIFIEKHNFLFAAKAITIEGSEKYQFNYFNKILLISSILFFYLVPFVYLKILKITVSKKDFVLALIIFLISIFFFDYKSTFSGGGIFFKISYFFLDNKIFFLMISLLSIYSIINIFKNSYFNFLIFLLLIASNIQLSIYHKYYDPLFVILIFSILQTQINFEIMKKFKSQLTILLYFSVFLILGFIK